MAWLGRLGAVGVVAVALAATANTAVAAPEVSAPAQVRVGDTVEVRLAGFRARTRVDVRLAPTETRGGSCCGIVVVKELAVGRDGRAIARFVWPRAYYRAGGLPAPPQPNAAWREGESVDVEASTGPPIQTTRTTTVVRDTGGGAPPGRTVTWEAPPFGGELARLGGGNAVPFDLVVDGQIAGTATLVAGSQPRLVGSPRRVYEIKGPDGTVRFSLMAGGWRPRAGMTGPTSNARLTLAWPGLDGARLRLPLLEAATSIALTRPTAQVVLSGTLAARLETGIVQVAEWILRRGYLPPPYQAATVARYLQDNLDWLIDAYRLALDARQLRDQATQLLAQAVPLARDLGVALPGPQDVVRVIEQEARAISDRLHGALAGLYEFTIGRIATSAATPGPPTRRDARARAPLGLRSASPVRAPMRRQLRRARLARLTRAGARAAARALLRPSQRARVGPLLLERRSVRGRRGRVAVAAAGLASDPVVLTVVGPGYAAEAPLGVRRGVAAAAVRLPRRPGSYRIGIADLNRTDGARLATATVRRR